MLQTPDNGQSRPAGARTGGTAVVRALVLGLALVLSGGCEREDPISVYRAPKDPPRRMDAAAAMPTTAPAVSGPTWTVPAGWRSQAAGGMRFASFAIDSAPDIVLTVIPLVPSGLLANVNRWEQELGLAPSREQDLPKVTRRIEVDGMPVDLVDLTGPTTANGPPPRSTLAAIIPRPDRMWFIKMTGPAEQVAAQRSNFQAFIESIRFDQ